MNYYVKMYLNAKHLPIGYRLKRAWFFVSSDAKFRTYSIAFALFWVLVFSLMTGCASASSCSNPHGLKPSQVGVSYHTESLIDGYEYVKQGV